MPRLSRALVAERETFAEQCFAAGQNVDQAQASIAAKYDGVKMNPYRLKEIFDSKSWQVALPITEPEVPSTEEIIAAHDTDNFQQEGPAQPETAPTYDRKPTKRTWSSPIEKSCVITSTEGFMTIREILKAMEKGTYPL